MQIKIIIAPLFIACLACNNGSNDKPKKADTEIKTEMTFDKSKWRIKDGNDYPYRDAMLADLIDSKKLKPLKENEIVNLLGEPTRSNKNYLYYMIEQQRLVLWPLHTKTLVIKLLDSTENLVLIHE